jgi:hypothetical protein
MYQQVPRVCSVYNTESATGVPGGPSCTYLANKEGWHFGTDVIEPMHPLIHGVAMPMRSKSLPPRIPRSKRAMRLKVAAQRLRMDSTPSFRSCIVILGASKRRKSRRLSVLKTPRWVDPRALVTP